MKRIISFILAFIISITCIFSAGISYADNRPHIEDALNNLQTQAGYIPFQNSSVQYNCFGFISDVCARLYSVTYYYEQQVGNYRFNHTSNYFTVSQATFPDSSYAKSLKEWLCANAAVGDVLQIGCANDNDSKKHTVLIQHIDDEKLCFIIQIMLLPAYPRQFAGLTLFIGKALSQILLPTNQIPSIYF